MKGQAVSIDFIAAMVIFVFMVAAGFYVVQNNIVADSGFTRQVAAAADSAFTSFRDETDWTVYRTPIAIRSNQSLDNEPVTVAFPYPGIVANSTLTMREGREIPSQHNRSTNRTLVVADLREGGTRLDVVYTHTGSLDDRTYTTDLTEGGDSVWNDRLNVTFTSEGFSTLELRDTGMLQSTADLAGGATPTFDEQLLRVNATYSSGRKHVRIFEDSPQIRITEFFTGEREWQLNLTSSFDTLYSSAEGDTVDIAADGEELYAAQTDWVDFSDTSAGSEDGLSIVGEDIFVNVSSDGSGARREVTINFSDSGGRKDLLLYAHEGNHTNATAQKRDFYHPYTVTVGVPEPVEGVSEENAEELEQQDYDALQDTLGLTELDYNISIDGVFTAGKDVETDTTVNVIDIPVPVVHRFGNGSVKSMVMRVWN